MLLACALVISATNTARAQTRDEAAIRALGDGFAKVFVQKNAEARASLFAENGTFVTPQGDFLQGHVAMVKDFGPEAQQAVNGTTQATLSNYRVRFIKPDVAVTDCYPHRAQCQWSRWQGHPGNTDQFFLRGYPSREPMADRGWAGALRACAG